MEQQKSSSTDKPLAINPPNWVEPQARLAWLIRYSVVLAVFFPVLGVWLVIWGPIQHVWAAFIPLACLAIPMAWLGYTIHYTRSIVGSVEQEIQGISARVARLEK